MKSKKEKIIYPIGTTKQVTKFLWLPKRFITDTYSKENNHQVITKEWRWLEYATIEYKYVWGYEWGLPQYKWKATKFINN